MSKTYEGWGVMMLSQKNSRNTKKTEAHAYPITRLGLIAPLLDERCQIIDGHTNNKHTLRDTLLSASTNPLPIAQLTPRWLSLIARRTDKGEVSSW